MESVIVGKVDSKRLVTYRTYHDDDSVELNTKDGEQYAVFLVSIPTENATDGNISKVHNFLKLYRGDLEYVKDLFNNDGNSDVDLSVEIIDGKIHFIEI